MVRTFSKIVLGVMCAVGIGAGITFMQGSVAAEQAPAPAEQKKIEFSDQAFLDAAYDNCATVENRSAASCDCERKLIGDRVNADDKKMAFYYWTDKARFATEFEAKRNADATWQKGFAERFTSLQALVISACGA
ncbi:MAG: hypothetical protein ACRBCJ_05330 [Hyphomicrobiaceae bacterium]